MGDPGSRRGGSGSGVVRGVRDPWSRGGVQGQDGGGVRGGGYSTMTTDSMTPWSHYSHAQPKKKELLTVSTEACRVLLAGHVMAGNLREASSEAECLSRLWVFWNFSHTVVAV